MEADGSRDYFEKKGEDEKANDGSLGQGEAVSEPAASEADAASEVTTPGTMPVGEVAASEAEEVSEAEEKYSPLQPRHLFQSDGETSGEEFVACHR